MDKKTTLKSANNNRELSLKCGGRVAEMWSRRQAVTGNDGCSEMDMTDGERKKRGKFDNLDPSAVKE